MSDGGQTTLTPMTPAQVNAAESAQWKEIVKQALFETRVAVPAIIQEFDAEKQVATVQIAIREIVRTTTGPKTLAIAPIYNVPVVFPRGGGFVLTMPLKAGDECLLVFSDNCFDLWWARGGVQDQFERRRHDLTDCFAVPGPWSQQRLVVGYATDATQLRSEDGAAVIEITATGDINITSPGTIRITGSNVIITPLTGGTF